MVVLEFLNKHTYKGFFESLLLNIGIVSHVFFEAGNEKSSAKFPLEMLILLNVFRAISSMLLWLEISKLLPKYWYF